METDSALGGCVSQQSHQLLALGEYKEMDWNARAFKIYKPNQSTCDHIIIAC